MNITVRESLFVLIVLYLLYCIAILCIAEILQSPRFSRTELQKSKIKKDLIPGGTGALAAFCRCTAVSIKFLIPVASQQAKACSGGA